MAETNPVERVVDVLEAVGSYKRVASTPFRERGSSFDAVLKGADPMSIVVIEYKDRPDAQFCRDIIRELRTFVWSLFNEGKRHMVSAVLVLGGEVPEDQLRELTRSLNGTCRLYVVSRDTPIDQLKAELVSLGSPDFFSVRREDSNADKLILEILAVKGKARQEFARQLVELVEGSSSAEDVARKLLKSYREQVREVENAAASPRS